MHEFVIYQFYCCTQIFGYFPYILNVLFISFDLGISSIISQSFFVFYLRREILLTLIGTLYLSLEKLIEELL